MNLVLGGFDSTWSKDNNDSTYLPTYVRTVNTKFRSLRTNLSHSQHYFSTQISPLESFGTFWRSNEYDEYSKVATLKILLSIT